MSHSRHIFLSPSARNLTNKNKSNKFVRFGKICFISATQWHPMKELYNHWHSIKKCSPLPTVAIEKSTGLFFMSMPLGCRTWV